MIAHNQFFRFIGKTGSEPYIGPGGWKRVSRFFSTGKIGDVCQKIEKTIAEHSKCDAPLSSQSITLKIWLIRAAAQATPSFATATTGACGNIIDNDRTLMQLAHQHKIVGIPDCLMPRRAINDDVRIRIISQSFCNNCRQGKTWYLSGRREIPQGRHKIPHGEPKRWPSQGWSIPKHCPPKTQVGLVSGKTIVE